VGAEGSSRARVRRIQDRRRHAGWMECSRSSRCELRCIVYNIMSSQCRERPPSQPGVDLSRCRSCLLRARPQGGFPARAVAHPVLLRDVQSLALGGLAAARKRPAGLGVSALAPRDARATLARPPSHIGDGAFAPGPVQVVPGGVEQAPGHVPPLRRAQTDACQSGTTGSGLALVKRQAAPSRRRPSLQASEPLADYASERLVASGQSCGGSRRDRGGVV